MQAVLAGKRAVTAADDAEVDRLAEVACDADTYGEGIGWYGATEPIRDAYRAIVRAVLAAQQQPAPTLLTTNSGQAAWSIEVVPREWPQDGRSYESGVGTPNEAQDALRRIAHEVDGWLVTRAQADANAVLPDDMEEPR